MDYKKLLELLQQQQKDQYSDIAAAAKQMGDRIKMQDPDIQGPRLPERTPEEESMANASMNVAMGTVGGPKTPRFDKLNKLLGITDDTAINTQRSIDAVNKTAERMSEIGKEVGKIRNDLGVTKRGQDTTKALRAIQAAKRSKK